MAANSERRTSPLLRIAAVIVGVAIFCWIFPLFRVEPLASSFATATASATGQFDAKTAAAKIWTEQLIPATGRAADLTQVALAVRQDPDAARKSFGQAAGVGVAYFFVRGSGKVVARERNVLHLAVDGAPNELVALRIGPVFGNVVRDGIGVLDVNAFPGLQEFNALSAELNALVEQQVLPAIRENAKVGTRVRFAGCAEVPETAEEPGEPLFTVVPVQADIP